MLMVNVLFGLALGWIACMASTDIGMGNDQTRCQILGRNLVVGVCLFTAAIFVAVLS